MIIKSFQSLTLICLLLVSCQAQLPEKDNEEVNKLIREEVRRTNIPSLSAAIVTKKGIVWHNSYGRQNREGDASSDETIYLLSSISKLVVAVAIMQQVEKGKLNLDKDVNNYLSFKVRNFYFKDKPITARLLMTHQTGLANPGNEVPGVNQLLPAGQKNELYPWIKNVLDEKHPGYNKNIWKDREPGTVFSNSNFGMTLLAHLVEAVSGEPFDSYARKYIFEPLGMNKTGYRLEDTDLKKRATLFLRGREISSVKFRIYPAGQLWSSTRDWSKFAVAMLNGGKLNGKRILKKESVKKMLEVRHPDANMAYGGGLGLIWRSYDNHQWLGHTGGGGLVTGTMLINQKLGVGVIIFTNAGGKLTVSPFGKTYKLLQEKALGFKE